jgi:hypothetical protein
VSGVGCVSYLHSRRELSSGTLVGKLKVEKGVKRPSRALIRLSRLAALKGVFVVFDGVFVGRDSRWLGRVGLQHRIARVKWVEERVLRRGMDLFS